MEVIDENNQCCFGCLCSEENLHLQQFSFQCEPLKTIFQVDSIVLCIICKRIAQHADLFIKNVQSNQILLQNVDLSSLQTIRSQVLPCISLANSTLPFLELSGTSTEESCVVLGQSSEQKVKLELKEELDTLDEEFIDEVDDFQDPDLKEEFSLASLLKEELEIVDCNELKTLTKSIKKKLKKKDRNDNSKKISKKCNGPKMTISDDDPPNYIRMVITEKQCMLERQKRMQKDSYLGSTYKCEDCIKGFLLKQTFDKHMVLHNLSSGKFCCTICKQRFDSLIKLRSHKRCHFVRYKCPDCGVMRVCHNSIKEHCESHHSNNFPTVYKCAHCPKIFNNRTKYRKHETYTHSDKGRVICNVCNKSYVNKDSLLAHILRKHPPDGATDSSRKRHVCSVCGCVFGSPSHLKNHALVHSDLRPYYCVECDRSFKTAAVLKQHLKIAKPHVNYLELPLSCGHCDKRFSIKRDLERHMNRVHLNIKPYTCDQCDRAYVNSWSLRDHQRYSHDGVKRLRRYPCAMCDKVFDCSSTLKSHVRTHTGERPYHCAQCPAQFAQGSALGTHVKLVHLKLTRDGRPKQASMK